MRKFLLGILFLLCFAKGFSQQLYSAAVETGSRFNPGLSQASNPKVAFDDILIPSATVGSRDSIRITKVKVGIRRLANAAATNVSLYYSVKDDTATLYNNLLAIPPTLIGTVSLPANGATSVTEIVSLGDSVNTLFRVKVDTGKVYTGYQLFFIGIGLSSNDGNEGIRLTTGDANDDVMWIYNQDSTVKRVATYFGGSPKAQFYIQVFGKPGGVFPVVVSDFTGHKDGNKNILTWNTSSESNSKGFEVQRSADGKSFSSIGFNDTKADNGNSSNALNYSYADEKPLVGTNYYRLKQVDKDGKFNYSAIVALKGDKSLQISAVYPNPVKDQLNVAVSSLKAEKATIVITDLSGKVIKQINTSLIAGDNNISVNVSSFATGSYTIKLIASEETKTTQFLKN